jgi:hypothetical protein
MAKRPQADLEATKRLMGALVRISPKQHDEMRIGKSQPKPTKRPKAKKPRLADS